MSEIICALTVLLAIIIALIVLVSVIIKMGKGFTVTVVMPDPPAPPQIVNNSENLQQMQKDLDKAITDERQVQKQTAELIQQINSFMTGGESNA